jgi:hypothetical protein
VKKLALLVWSAAVMVVLWPAAWASASTLPAYFVDPQSGNDNSNCGLATAPCQTLNQALQNDSLGSQIFITKPGIFGPIYINAPVVISGPPEGQAIIQWNASTLPGCVGGAPGSCNGGANTTYSVDVQAGAGNDFKLDNVTLHSGGGSTISLHVGSASGVWLWKDIIHGTNGAQTILVDSSQGSLLRLDMSDCDVGFSASGGGITITPSGDTPLNVTIADSTFHSATFGVQAIASTLSGGASIVMNIEGTKFYSFNNSALSLVAPSNSDQISVSLARSSISTAGGAGIKANGAGVSALIYETVISHNGTGINIVGGATGFSANDNTIRLNGVNCEVSGAATACSSALGQLGQD